jgi:hypothetical protein
MKSPEFASLWSHQPVDTCVSGTEQLRHPTVGRLELHVEAVPLPDHPGHRDLTYTAGPGSPSEAALTLLTTAPARAHPSRDRAPSTR